jgi:hypothetical protein
LVSSALTANKIQPRPSSWWRKHDKHSAFLAAFAARVLGNGRLSVDKNEKNDFQTGFRICPTFGEILEDGRAIEPVTGSSPGTLTLLHFDGKQCLIAPQIHVGLTTYVAPFLDYSVLGAIRFPSGAAEYGSTEALFWKTAGVFRQYLRFSEELAAFVTLAVFGTWFADCYPSPITVFVTGSDLRQAMRLFQLFGIFCRRPITVAELNRQLPICAHPTLLVVDLVMSEKSRSFWRATNHRSVFVAAGRGAVSNLACAKVIFSETGDDSREDWGRESMYLRLSPDTNELPPLTAPEEEWLAAEFQPQFLMYRLRHLHLVHQSVFASSRPRLPGFELGRSLLACVQEEPKIVKAVAPLLQAHEQALLERRLLDPEVAIVEALWSPAHNEKEFAVKELTTRVNALLRSRGEISTYNEKQVGWKLRNMDLNRHHNGKCKVVRFSRETRRRIHQLAVQFGLELSKVPDCADCEDPQLIAPK